MSVVKIAVCGAAGRMGRRIIACAEAHPQVQVVGAVDVPGCPALGQDAGTLAGGHTLGVEVTDELAAALAPADVVIDFALADGLPSRIRAYAEAGVAAVIGATGAGIETADTIGAAVECIPVIHAPNFSLGVNLLFALTRKAAQALDESYDIEIVEMHHRRKRDAPSGTALRLVETVEEARGYTAAQKRVHGRQGVVGERTAGEIGVHALRGGDVVGEHTVVFATEGEQLELTHKAGSRDTFAHGALKAALYLHDRNPGFYTMADVLGLALE
jgi:4-hydroxy-tetrahydrodipicolinate reductase